MNRIFLPRHSRTITVGEAPINGVDAIPKAPSTIQTPDGTIYMSQELADSRQTVGILMGAAGGIGAGVLGAWIARKL